ncbi:hypothetical protein [Streptomyces galbus]|uniref:Uncharacterized protein n=1 Tax=Streptomyces galbus TaxID=33898 RepID=A0A4U5W3W9_STRGB|nr:hypothetical protein [Streptomyces galbus]TKS96067.1 hypothetical protein E4U92_34955 [Streptomyces galbus]GHD52367.1 hypothetical protein GCM10010335_64760 [Streptomyces galbus]
MNTWEERLANASTCEPRRSFDVAGGLRRLAQDAGYLPPPASAPEPTPKKPDRTSARHRLTAVSSWSVTQAGAASHVKYLADIIGTTHTVFEGWTDDLDIDGIHVFACSLYLAHHPESARFWWGLAAGADHGAAAYCLYLQHLTNGEQREADLWWGRVVDALGDSAGGDLNAPAERTNLSDVLETFAGYRARTGAHRVVPIGGLREEVDRLAGQADDGLLGRPDRRLADRLRELTSH